MADLFSSGSASGQPRRPRPQDIAGWGADLSPDDRPAVPRERRPPRLPAHAQRQPPAQACEVEVLHSNERAGLTPVFGSSVPPAGLSGRLRRWAFGFGEGDLRHWLLLLLADRVNVIEGLGQDLAQGHLPNLLAELGWRAQWRYNRPALLRRLLTASAVAALLLMARQAHRRPRLPQLPPPRR